ncbi:hypothetical protein DFH09DRAFT_1418165 [Mycena vulgaris]|nr:hypothetical protein DFH09DRAFT_1418165 [Mycena vulgaris]
MFYIFCSEAVAWLVLTHWVHARACPASTPWSKLHLGAEFLSINILSLLHPASSPPYAAFVARIIESTDQQASIFLHQMLKVGCSSAPPFSFPFPPPFLLIDAICARGKQLGCLEAATSPEERRKIVACMCGRIADLATNCYGLPSSRGPTGAADLRIAALACHETGSLVVQHALENLEESAKDGIVNEPLGQGAAVFGEVAKGQ